MQEIFDLYEQERSIVREAKILNDRNAISRYGHEWSPVTVHLVLMNIFYVGDYRYNALREGDRSKPKPESEWIIVKDHHPAIISREQFARVQAILKANKRYRKDMAPASSRERIHIFGGLLFCGNCGKPLNNSVSNKRRTAGNILITLALPAADLRINVQENLHQTRWSVSSYSTIF